MADFENWDYGKAAKALEETAVKAAGGKDHFAASRGFVDDGDHWQDGSGWVGPYGTEATKSTVLAKVAPQFTPADVLREALDRKLNALMKREPAILLEPVVGGELDETAKRLVDTRIAELSTWWDRRGVKLWARARTATRRMLWAGHGTVRLWIPPSLLQKGNDGALRMPTGLTFAQALDRIYLSAPPPDAAMLYTDPDTQQTCALVTYGHVTRTGEEATTEKIVEVWWVDAQGKTQLRVHSNKEGATTKASAYDWQGTLPLAQAEGPPSVTDAVRQQQRRINFFESVLVRNIETAGFPERYILNAEPPGLWSKTPPVLTHALKTQEVGGETWYLHPEPLTLGSSIVTQLVGIETRDKEGNQSVATPTVTFRDPTDPDFVIKASEHAVDTLLRQLKQKHVAMEKTGEASGTAYQQARTDFVDDLEESRGPAEGMIRDVLASAIAIAESMTRESAFLKKYRPAVHLHVNPGPATPEETRVGAEEVGGGRLSLETHLAKQGVEDVPAEVERIRMEPMARLKLIEQAAKTVDALALVGVVNPVPLLSTILPEEDVKLITDGRTQAAA